MNPAYGFRHQEFFKTQNSGPSPENRNGKYPLQMIETSDIIQVTPWRQVRRPQVI